MIIDNKGRLFGKVSIIDILVILFIFTAAAGIYYKFAVLDRGGVAARFDTIEYSVKTSSSVRMVSVNAVTTDVEAYDGETGGYIGKVINKEVSPAKNYIIKSDGTYVEAETPDRYDITITVQVPGVENDHGFFANGNKEIRRGSDLKLKTRMIELETKVVDVKTVKK